MSCGESGPQNDGKLRALFRLAAPFPHRAVPWLPMTMPKVTVPSLWRKKTFTALLVALSALTLASCRGVVGEDQLPNPDAGLPATASPVKRVVVVVMQNRSFNHLFGMFPGANGIRPGTPGFTQNDANGNPVTPH